MLCIKDKENLIQILKHCKRIEDKTNGIDMEFFQNLDLREIVCFNILLIGELAGCLSSDNSNEYNSISLKRIKEMSDVIEHKYEMVDKEVLFNTANSIIVY